MISKQAQVKGILAKLLETGIKILIKKECKQIGEIKIDIIASSVQIIKGKIQKIHIKAEEINYKDLLFDKIELEANNLNIIFKLNSKELKFKNKFIIHFNISLSEKSLKTILLSNSWNWIGNMITKGILNKDQLEDIKIKNDQLLIKGSKDKQTISEGEKIGLRAEKGKIYLSAKTNNNSIKIPIEDKVYIKTIDIRNNLIIISASSSLSI